MCRRVRRQTAISHQRFTPGIQSRSGFATIWCIACLPIVIAAIAFVVSIGRLNLARTELKSAAEATSIVGSRVWGQAGDGPGNDATGRITGLAAANAMVSSNTAIGVTPSVVSIEMGTYVSGVFVSGAPAPAASMRAVRATLNVTVPGKFGASDYTVKGQSLAWFNGTRSVLTFD